MSFQIIDFGSIIGINNIKKMISIHSNIRVKFIHNQMKLVVHTQHAIGD